MPPYNEDEHYNVEGLHGTIAEQTDEAHYDDRSDASDDIEKGRLKFPDRMYGRERELEILRNIYGQLVSSSIRRDIGNSGEDNCLPEAEEKEVEPPAANQGLATSPGPYKGSSVVFLSGYSGIGKSAIANEFVKKIQCEYQSSDESPILYARGKYTEQSTASAPFSAIAEVFERLALGLSKDNKNDQHGTPSNDLRSTVQRKIRESDLIGPGTEGNRVLRATFPALAPLLDVASQRRKPEDGFSTAVHPSMNAIKECAREILSIICETLERPLILFLDDLQWGDGASIEMLSFLLSCTKLTNVVFICAYRSNEVDADHSFTKLMENVTKARRDGKECNAIPHKSVERMDLFSLSPDAISKFIADSIKKEDADEVGELSEVVYQKTMGNIFFVKQALEELVRKNVLFYDMIGFEWRFIVSKAELANYMSDDVVETVKGKIRELSVDVQNLLVVMAYIPNALDVPIIKALMSHGEFSFGGGKIRDLLKEASDEGMLIFSIDSKCYVFAHDRIRQASLEFAKEEDQDELLLHISQVLQDFAVQGPEMEWCLYVAVDLLNFLPLGKTDCAGLIELNMKVSKIARSRGSIGKENELLHKGLAHLESSGKMWNDYDITLELYNAVIISDHSLGSYSNAKLVIDKILKNAKSLDDKLQAYIHQMLCEIEETSDFSQGANDGVKILKLYGYNIPATISTTYMMKEEMKVKMALKNGSYSCLAKLPLKDEPILSLFMHVQKFALYASNEKLVKILAGKAIRCAIKRGMSRHLPLVMVSFASSLAKQGKVKTAQELGHVSIAISDKIPDDMEICVLTRALAHMGVLPQLQSFRSMVEPILQCHKDLKLVGGFVEMTLGSMLAYFESFFAAGLELGPLLESKLLLVEDLCRSLGRPGFLTNFQIYRQFALNLRKRIENPTEFQGEAFHEEKSLNKMNGNALKMALRDSSSLRLQLAFVFWNENIMAQMLERLRDYPLKDMSVARLHNRLCFTGLAAFALCQRQGYESFSKLGKNCLRYFAHLTKHGSVNAKPVYLFMLAMQVSRREVFEKAIDACNEASMVHLEAMAKERYAALLKRENDTPLSNDYITSSYWLYQDWGAHGKALQLSQQYDFLQHSTRKNAKSVTSSTAVSKKSAKRNSLIIPTYSFNTTFKSRKMIYGD